MKTVTVNIISSWDSSEILFSADVDASIDERCRLRAALEIGVKAGADLVGANLVGADLAGANLVGANLAGANLVGASFAGDLKLIGLRPFLSIGPIGLVGRTFMAWITNQGLRLRAGCFFGTRDEFIAQLESTHGENEHAKEYRAALTLIDAHVEIWAPVADAPDREERAICQSQMYEAANTIEALQSENATLKADLAALREVEREKVAAWILSFGFATGHGDTIEDLLSEAGTQIQELRAAQEWVPVSERLPEKNTAVDLINVERYVADDNLNEPFVTDVGYWNQLGYWAIRGEHGMTRDAFTHWRARGPLPPQPAQENAEDGV